MAPGAFSTTPKGTVGSIGAVVRVGTGRGWLATRRKRHQNLRSTTHKVCHSDGVLDEHGRTRHVFAADAPNELWLTDITEHKTAEGKLYLCAIKDGRFQGANATRLISSSSFSRGVWNPRVLRGRSLSWVTMAWISASVTALKSVPFG